MTDWNQTDWKQTHNPPPQPKVEDRVRAAAAEAESELKRWISYFNDQVVPDVRRNGSAALKTAAAELDKLARRMEAHTGPASTPPPPPRKPGA